MLQMAKLTDSQNREQLIYKPRALAALNCFLVAVFLSKVCHENAHGLPVSPRLSRAFVP